MEIGGDAGGLRGSCGAAAAAAAAGDEGGVVGESMCVCVGVLFAHSLMGSSMMAGGEGEG